MFASAAFCEADWGPISPNRLPPAALPKCMSDWQGKIAPCDLKTNHFEWHAALCSASCRARAAFCVDNCTSQLLLARFRTVLASVRSAQLSVFRASSRDAQSLPSLACVVHCFDLRQLRTAPLPQSRACSPAADGASGVSSTAVCTGLAHSARSSFSNHRLKPEPQSERPRQPQQAAYCCKQFWSRGALSHAQLLALQRCGSARHMRTVQSATHDVQVVCRQPTI